MSEQALKVFAEETEPSLESVRSLRLRLADAPARRPSVAGPLALGLSLGAAAAALMLVVLLRAGGPPALDQALVAEAAPARTEPVAGLSFDYRGIGHLGGTAEEPELEWQAGTVDVAVEPSAGRSLRVHTKEGTVRVVGTAFTVTRDARGTRVEVRQGVVAVRCEGRSEQTLDAGASHTCPPVTAAGMLARARALQGDGWDVDSILAAVERGLTMPGLQEPVAVELRIVEVEALRDAGRSGQALDKARALRPGAGHRAEEVGELIRALEAEVEAR